MVDQPNTSSPLEGRCEKDDSIKISVARKKKSGIKGKVKAGMSLLFERAPAEKYKPSSPVGITDELLAFVTDLVKRPKTWIRFPLPEDAKANEFALNDEQQLHVGAVERELPKLTKLRFTLCPDRMSEGRFWMVYFVMLHPKLNKDDALALSSHQIVKARKLLAAESKDQGKDTQGEASLVASDGHLESMKDVSTSASTSNPTHLNEGDVNPHNNILSPDKGLKHLKADQVEENESSVCQNEKRSDKEYGIGKDIPISCDERISFSEWKGDDTEATKYIA